MLLSWRTFVDFVATVRVKNKADVAKKTAFKRELLENFNINIENIPFMDMELAMVCAQKMAETFHLILLDKDWLFSFILKWQR